MDKYVINQTGSKALIALAAEAIEVLSDHYTSVNDAILWFGANKAHPSFVNNLKDAIMHFQKMHTLYNSIGDIEDLGSGEELIEYTDPNLQTLLQFEFLSEHLTRGIVDAYIRLLQYASRYYKTFYYHVSTNPQYSQLRDAKPFLLILFKAMRFCKTSLYDLRNNKRKLHRILNLQTMTIDDGYFDAFTTIIDTLDEMQRDISSRLTEPLYNLHTALLKSSLFNCKIYHPTKEETVTSVVRKFDIDLSLFCKANDITRTAIEMPVGGFSWLVIPKTASQEV